MHILLIEGEEAGTSGVGPILTANGFIFDTAEDGEDGIQLAKLTEYDLIILNDDLADMPGVVALRRLRNARVDTPVMILAHNSNLDARVRMLQIGADDHLKKPFQAPEFVARIHAIVRRWRGYADQKIAIGDVILDLDQRSVMVNGRPVFLTPKEFAVLELLALRKESTVTREMILTHLYHGQDEPEVKIIDTFVCKIRRKLTGSKTAVLKTIWGVGYSMHLAEQQVAEVTLAA